MAQTTQGSFFAKGSHTSYIGALRADSKKGRKLRAYLLYLGHVGSATDHEAKDALALPIQSICSLRNSPCGSGSRRKASRRRSARSAHRIRPGRSQQQVHWRSRR